MKISAKHRSELRRLRKRLIDANKPEYFGHAIAIINRELNDADNQESADEESLNEAIIDFGRQASQRAKQSGGKKVRNRKVL